jgi:chemotaxis protein histidine kinase CheA
MVLDAVARIEQSLATQKQVATETRLDEALAAIRQAVDEVQASAIAALDGIALDQHLVPVRKGARVIREIAWRLREIGADGRICDLIDSQVGAIETGAAQISSEEARSALDAAFASLEGRLAEFDDGSSPQAKPPEQARVVPFPTPTEVVPVADVETVGAETAAPETIEVEIAEPAMETPVSAAAPAHEDTVAFAVPVETADEAAADAHDEAMLDLIAAEMAAPDPVADDIEIAAGEVSFAEPVLAQPEAAAESTGPIAAQAEAPAAPSPPHPVPAPEPAMEVSLGSTIIASGMLRRPGPPASDPLAPIRRMSQAEKIAFFS